MRPRPRRDNPVLYIVAGVGGLLGFVLLIAYALDSQPHVSATSEGSSAKAAIRAYLKDNLNDADFEEIKWYPPLPAKGLKIAVIDGDSRTEIDHREGMVLVRLRFRARNLAGAKIQKDETFFVVGSRVLGQETSSMVSIFDGANRRMTD